ncbi:MAG: DUF1428 domain-containing protein [Bacteroidia bacterium]
MKKEYIDGFVLPISKIHLAKYTKVAKKVSDIWIEYGALSYHEFVGDDMTMDGTRSFVEAAKAQADETIIFGWVVFPSKEIRNLANKKVPQDPRMSELVGPLIQSKKMIFDANRMIYGGFKSLLNND